MMIKWAHIIYSSSNHTSHCLSFVAVFLVLFSSIFSFYQSTHSHQIVQKRKKRHDSYHHLLLYGGLVVVTIVVA